MEDDGLSFDFEEALQSAPAQQPAPARTVSPYVQGSGAPGAAQAMAVASYNPSTSGRHFRQTVCTYWLKGLCMKGDDCGFLHEFDTARMPLCRNLIKYGECRDKDCVFKHAQDDMKECNMYRLGFCVYGAQCRYKHTRLPGPPPDPASVDAARPRGPRTGPWPASGFQPRRFDQLGQAQRPPSIPRPSAADLSSGRVPEPSQPTQTLPPEAQPSPQQPEQQQDGQQQHQQQGEQLEDGPGSEQQRQQQQQQQQHQQHPMQQGFMTPQQYQMMQFQQMRMMQQMMAMQQQQGMHHGARGPMGPWKGQRQQQQQQPRPFQGINQGMRF